MSMFARTAADCNKSKSGFCRAVPGQHGHRRGRGAGRGAGNFGDRGREKESFGGIYFVFLPVKWILVLFAWTEVVLSNLTVNSVMQMLASYLKGEIEGKKKKRAVCSHNAGEILCPFTLARWDHRDYSLTCLASPTPLSNAQHYLSQPSLKHLANMAGLNKSKVEELLMQSQAYINCVILSLGSLKEKHEIGY